MSQDGGDDQTCLGQYGWQVLIGGGGGRMQSQPVELVGRRWETGVGLPT